MLKLVIFPRMKFSLTHDTLAQTQNFYIHKLYKQELNNHKLLHFM